MTKVCTHGRGKDVALAMLEQSLRRLQTDHLDLWQVHGVSFDNDPDLAYAKGGVLEALDKAKKDGKVKHDGIVTVDEALSYAMSLPVATTISGIDSLAVLRQNLKIARGFTPLTAKRMQALRQRCAPYAADGHLEMYKTTMKYDADVGRAQHGFCHRKSCRCDPVNPAAK